MNQPEIVKIESIQNETDSIKTITFFYKLETIPGQFFMIWIPGIDEIPMSVSNINNDNKAITFRVVGDATKSLFNLKKHDLIGIRGPYGNGFSFHGNHHLFIGGGTGIAMIAPAVESCLLRDEPVDVILGAKTKDELFFIKRLQKTDANVHIATDDGSKGYKGYTSKLTEKIIKEKQIDTIYTCGPELMMKSIFEICIKNNISLQASLERYMKCAVGICGQCCIGEGLRVCIEGPIFSDKQLLDISDFGVFNRNASGKKKNIQP
ncbi:dihydroorotate dehydrogenase electron transfer subunit [Thermoplasmatales archaeon ex4572_165]|nr:MAG: dihydroorotate dehydrogenase electron transfer subunit [Thermoplasmatales archaeon ex4572_165]RLF57986.1 MAG: dihydroorotate dehydrogenase electron transfer subunit [Thermoplasmata archaeon]